MSTQIFLFKSEIFSDKKKNDVFQYLLHTLFLQNCEFIIRNGDPLSDFLNFVDFLIFKKTETISKSFEFSSNNEIFSKHHEYIKNFFRDLSKFTNVSSFYEYILENSPVKTFDLTMEIIIQRLLLLLMTDLRTCEDSLNHLKSSEFINSLESLMKNEISKDEVMIWTFLTFIEKNCKLISESKEHNSNHCYIINEKLPYLLIFLDEDNRLVPFILEKDNSELYEQKEVKFKLKELKC